MTSDPERLRERVRETPAEAIPAEFARAVWSSPRDADVVGEVLAALAEEGPFPGATEAVAGCLEADDVSVRRGGALALRVCTDAAPAVEATVSTALAGALTDGDHVVRRHALVALANAARARPRAAVECVDRLSGALDPDSLDLLSSGLEVATVAAETDPEAAVRLLGPLFDVLSGLAGRDPGETTALPGGASGGARDRYRNEVTELRRQRGRTVNVIATVLLGQPTAVAEVRDALTEALGCASLGPHRGSLAEVVGHVAETDPGAVEPMVDPLAGLLDEQDHEVVASAAWALGVLAEPFGERVADAAADHTGPLVDLLKTDDRRARVASAGLLAYVGEFRPEAARPAVDALVEMLNGGEPRERATAALALGHVGTDEALPALRSATDDADDTVRSTAERAISRIEERT